MTFGIEWTSDLIGSDIGIADPAMKSENVNEAKSVPFFTSVYVTPLMIYDTYKNLANPGLGSDTPKVAGEITKDDGEPVLNQEINCDFIHDVILTLFATVDPYTALIIGIDSAIKSENTNEA